MIILQFDLYNEICIQETIAMSSSKKKGRKSTPPKNQGADGDDLPTPHYLISCDVPTKQFILYLNELESVDKKFVVADLDPTHLLVKEKAKKQIESKIEAWQRENVYDPLEKVGEDLDVS